MREDRLFTGDTAYVSTFEFHRERERAPHLEQDAHRPRLLLAADLVKSAVEGLRCEEPDNVRVVDLGCGDGGLLSLIQRLDGVEARGYDFQPSNAAGWLERGVTAEALDFVNHWTRVPIAEIYVMTEVLEHLTDPHEMVRRIAVSGAELIASSPRTEHAGSHDECHAWAWDEDGYVRMIEESGLRVNRHHTVGMFQVVWAGWST